jgi:N-acetylglucosamine-6-phosphate deacetylase
MASLTPAERSGISHEVGSLEAGKLADVLVLGRDLEICQTVARGRPQQH